MEFITLQDDHLYDINIFWDWQILPWKGNIVYY